MSERAKFEKWLSDLEAKKSSTPPHVFDRVKADYSLRLDGVLDKLREHTSAMREHSENLTRKLAELEEAEQNLVDEKAENALRAEVGELSAAEWESFSRKTERTIAKLLEDQAVISADLERIRELLGSVDDKPATAAAPAPEPIRKEMNELEFLKSVVGSTPPGSKVAAAAPVEKPPQANPEPSPEPAPQAAAAPPAAPPQPPAQPPKPAPEPLIAKPVTGPVILPKAGQESLASRVTANNPIVLKNTGPTDAPRTLKCAECGAMNYSSEWYCERCGAELANI